MHVKKRALSILLVAAMLISLIVFSSAEAKTPGFHDVGPGNLSGGSVQVVGQETVVAHDGLTNETSIQVKFNFFIDPASYYAYSGGHYTLSYESEYLSFDGDYQARFFVNGVRNNNYRINFDDAHVNIYNDLIPSDMPSPLVGANGLAIELIMFFTPTTASKFLELDPSVGTEVKLSYFKSNRDGLYDFAVFDNGINEISLLEANLLPAIPAVVTYSGNMVTYDVGAGTRADMDAFKPVIVASGLPVIIADGTGLVIPAGGGNVAKAFDHWKSGSTTYESGQTIPMPNGGLPLTAVYSDDANEDGTPDNKQIKVTYTRRTGDEGVLTAPTGTTANGKFITEGNNKVIYVTSGRTISTSIATLDLTGLTDWEFAGYFIGSTKYDDTALSALTVTAPITIELRAMLDTNENGIDDRDTVTLTFLEPDGVTEVDSIDVLDRTPYTVYKEPTKDTILDFGEAGESGDPTEVTLPVVPSIIPGGKHTGWSIEPIMDGTKIIGVNAVPVYSEDQQVEIPDLRDPVDPEKPLVPPIVELNSGAVLIHRGVNGQSIGTPITIGSDDEIQLIAHPVVGDYANLPTRYNNKPFAGWTLTGPVAAANPQNPDIYYLDPYYANPIDLTITDPKKESDTTDDVTLDGFDEKVVPADSTYEVLDEEGNVMDSGKIADEGGEITLPFTEDLPVRNGDGDIFTGDWTVREEKNEDGSPNFVIAPEYAAPTGDDITIVVDVDSNANGNGLAVLKGFYANDLTSTASFYVRIGDGPAIASDAGRFNVAATAAFGFETLARPSLHIGELSAVTYVGPKTIAGVVYSEFSVTYKTVKSGIVKIAMSYGNVVPTEVPGGYVIVTVADGNKDGRVSSTDVSTSLRVTNEKSTPAKGEAGAYLYELMDINMDDRFSSTDISIVIRMVNEKVETN